MESSSIVSFNNDSAFQNTLKPENNVSVHELALHAMRDRCLLLQRRINALEADNMRLKMDITKNCDNSPYIPLQEDEKLSLHQKIAELKKQKSQLMHHVFMVSCENKNLWNKVSSINKTDKTTPTKLEYGKTTPTKLEYGKQPLLRTNTYIQSTPKTSASNQEKFTESSLEEISLKLINSYIQEKSQLVEQYEQMTQLQDDDVLNLDSIGFSYMEEPATDSLKEILSQTEKLHNMKKELVQQEKDLKLAISRLENMLQDGYKCPTCINRNGKTVSSEHKEIETSDSLVNFGTPADSTTFNENICEGNTLAYKTDQDTNEKRDEHTDMICPMCGETFPEETKFTEFRSHVEQHFTGEIEPDSIIDTFDNIPNSIDNML